MYPFFLQGSQGQLFAVYYPPGVAQTIRGQVLVVPPFAEEMNKSRRMLALQARALADVGFGTLIVDLYGTGDSGGDFCEARWEVWKADLAVALEWMQKKGGTRSVAVLGVRLGALLALDFCQWTTSNIDRVLFWQPQLGGELAMTQFFRLRSAGSAIKDTLERESTSTLRALLQGGDTVEVAGYELAPALVKSIDSLNVEAFEPKPTVPIYWYEVMSGERLQLSAVCRRTVERWRSQGIPVTARAIPGPPFWSTVEMTTAPALLSATCAAFDITG